MKDSAVMKELSKKFGGRYQLGPKCRLWCCHIHHQSDLRCQMAFTHQHILKVKHD